ncbi:hypothetical protein H5410_004503 [Solanum commersonii]|uniref:Uncharacterized protein n=1 Tax=Solanum commersonii TaxID=4109 RepID=A0A9J6B869_SOLCO|nr:hypothetical protein H5410_004503 [Solanum commersonii]
MVNNTSYFIWYLQFAYLFLLPDVLGSGIPLTSSPSYVYTELANNYLNRNAIWSYYARDQLMIYSNSRELRKANMDEVQRWILSLLKPEERYTTRALKVGFILAELLTRYIGHKYPDHICSKCNGEDNIILDV